MINIANEELSASLVDSDYEEIDDLVVDSELVTTESSNAHDTASTIVSSTTMFADESSTAFTATSTTSSTTTSNILCVIDIGDEELRCYCMGAVEDDISCSMVYTCEYELGGYFVGTG